MRSLKIAGASESAPPLPKGSIKNGTVATWRTDRQLKVVGVTRLPGGPIRTLPEVGQRISTRLPRRGVLRHGPHASALRGKTADYEFRYLRHVFHVHLQPLIDRKGRITGVQGTLKQVGPPPRPDLREPGSAHSDGDLVAAKTLALRRHRISVRQAMRSLELARAVAETARINADIRKAKAAADQERALQAVQRAEQAERRALFLADASSILDSSFDQPDILDRLARLIVLREADWVVLQFIEGRRLRRVVALHRDEALQATLEAVFPKEEEPDFLEPDFLEPDFLEPGYRARNGIHLELFATMSPEAVQEFVPTAQRRKRLKNLAVQSAVRTPIRSHGRTIGILMIGSGDPGRLFDLQDLQVTRDLAARISLARESTLLYEEAQREIAMRKEIEARMRILNQDLERRVLDRTRLLEEATREANSFAYTVAHDLRAPLRAITGFCHALKEDYSSAIDPTGQDYLTRIVTGAHKMDALIRDLLDYARLNRADITRSFLDLDPVVEGALHQMSAELLERRAEVTVDKPLGRAVAFAPILAQVLTNLISNGTKFVAPGVSPVIRIRAEVRPRNIRLLVQDNGIGIEPQHFERIFGMFERLNRAEEYPGTGIGLAIVRRAVERLGGSVGVESEPGKGSTFWVDLPSA